MFGTTSRRPRRKMMLCRCIWPTSVTSHSKSSTSSSELSESWTTCSFSSSSSCSSRLLTRYYTSASFVEGIASEADRRDILPLNLFNIILQPTSCLHYRLRAPSNFPRILNQNKEYENQTQSKFYVLAKNSNQPNPSQCSTVVRTVVRATQQVNGKWQFWGCQNSVTPEPID